MQFRITFASKLRGLRFLKHIKSETSGLHTFHFHALVPILIRQVQNSSSRHYCPVLAPAFLHSVHGNVADAESTSTVIKTAWLPAPRNPPQGKEVKMRLFHFPCKRAAEMTSLSLHLRTLLQRKIVTAVGLTFKVNGKIRSFRLEAWRSWRQKEGA